MLAINTRKYYLLSLVMFVATLIGINTIPVYCLEGRNVSDPMIKLGDEPGVQEICDEVNTYAEGIEDIHGLKILVFDGSILSFNEGGYDQISTDKHRYDLMTHILYTIKDSDIDAQVKSKFYNFVVSQDHTITKALQTLDEDFRPDVIYADMLINKQGFKGMLTKLLGALVIIIMILVNVTIMLDLLYINLVIFQKKVDECVAKLKGKPGGKYHLVSAAAREAVQVAESGGEPNSYYLIHRSFSIIILMIFMLLLISGKLFTTIATLISYVQVVIATFLGD